ncbi:hypothetical protein AGRA3207_007168 [Actinomadura graeca]|uniref:SCP2 domain-containing protein n=1 Tax=Actinomadura graeca TaxID=2750812 RepID=A0ABX8R7F6_9ACTN|nr:hypothetical protein [Actinomadura graeca]QXJ25647.1 hypothetical protein AGRA3207_007168 [Actinomadura graeca]
MPEDAAPAVGARSRSARHVTAGPDAADDPPFAAGLPVLLRLLEQVRPACDAELVSLRWDRRPPGTGGGTAGAAVRLEATVTRRVPGADPARATIHQSVDVVDDRDRVRAGASVAWSTPVALSPDTAAEWDAADFASVRWGGRLRERLAGDPRFARTTRSFDGVIAFAAADRQVHLRIYRGAVIDVARKSLDGATFVIEGTDLAWVGLLTAASNDFVRRTSDGRFRVSGSGYQYLRMIKAVMIMIDHARALARGTAHEVTAEATGA